MTDVAAKPTRPTSSMQTVLGIFNFMPAVHILKLRLSDITA